MELRLFQRTRGFLKLFPDKWRFFFMNLGHFWRLFFRNLRLLKDIFREVEAFLNYYEDFLKITRFFEGISKEMEASV
jgi:hypothetical protein